MHPDPGFKHIFIFAVFIQMISQTYISPRRKQRKNILILKKYHIKLSRDLTELSSNGAYALADGQNILYKVASSLKKKSKRR